jgi:hypothetical protein
LWTDDLLLSSGLTTPIYAAQLWRQIYERDRSLFVYFMQAAQGGPIKIGVAKRPDRRLAIFQPATPHPLVIRAVARGGRLAETTLHRRFSKERINQTEWFEPSESLLTFIAGYPSWDEVIAGQDCPEIETDDDYRQALAKLWEQGYSYDDIGGLLGVTRQRAHQIVRPHTSETVERPDRPDELIEVALRRLLSGAATYE